MSKAELLQGSFLHGDLFEVQREALAKAKDPVTDEPKRGFAYFMEMGLGKTRTVAYEAHFLFRRRKIDMLVILCPKSLRETWATELEELGFHHPVHLFDGTVEQMWKKVRKGGPTAVVVIHYDILLSKGGDFLEQAIQESRKIYCALDESTRIKNPSSVVGERLKELFDGEIVTEVRNPVNGKTRKIKEKTDKQVSYIRMLSGSPAPQGPHDLWNQFRLIGATNQTYFGWRGLYCKMGGFKAKQVIGQQNMDILRQRTAGFAFRAKKKDWTDLPEKMFPPPRIVEMVPKQRQAYLEMLNYLVTEMEDVEITASMAVAAKTKLQQIGSGFMYDADKNPIPIFSGKEKNPKVEELLSIIEEEQNKIIVFYHFTHSLTILQEALDRAKVNYVTLKSKMDDASIKEQKRRFNEIDAVQVCLMQSSSHKYGHTLLGTANRPCHTSVFFENTYDFESRVQCEDRNHRHGQKNAVTYIDIAASKEEKKIIKALQKKDAEQDALLRNLQEVLVDSLKDDVKELLGDEIKY